MDVASEVLEMEDELWPANREGDGSCYERVLAVDAIAVGRTAWRPRRRSFR